MADKLDPKDTITIAGLVITNRCESAGLVEVLARKGILSKKEALTAI